MKLKPFHSVFLLLVCGALASSHSINAQEGKGQGEIEGVAKETPHGEPDPTLTFESESHATVKIAPTIVPLKEIRDSLQVQVKPPVKPTKAPEKAQKEEDPLSFNFLYYIIEKFKLSDIIE